MIIRRRTTMRWGYRLGSTLAYFTDPELGAQRREQVLARLDSVGGRSRFGPLIAWLRELNEGRIGPPPSRGQFEDAADADEEWEGEDEETAGGDDGEVTVEELTIIEHQRTS